jgi:hypothetical protein
VTPLPTFGERAARFATREISAALGSTLLDMPRKRLTLADLMAAGTFDITNARHRRALDESGPLEDPELEAARLRLLAYRRTSDRAWGAPALRDFARLVAER